MHPHTPHSRAEVDAVKDISRTRQIYAECLKLIPHKTFTFAKIWLQKAHFDIRQGDLVAARKTLGQSLGMCPKDKLFKGYIALETKLFEFTRCRTLYQKWIEYNPSNVQAWIKFAELEAALEDYDRARAIFELAVEQEDLDMPELLWKSYIDFEEENGEYQRARELYERLLEKTTHVKVWISYAHFEINIPDSPDEDEEEASGGDTVSAEALARARDIFKRAHTTLKEAELKEDRLALLNAWKSFEKTHGTEEDLKSVEEQMPRRVKKRRKLEDGSFEEYWDLMFPTDEKGEKGAFKLFEAAQRWKAAQAALKEKEAKEAAGGDSEGEE